MVCPGFLRQISKRDAAFILITLTTIACPLPAQAQETNIRYSEPTPATAQLAQRVQGTYTLGGGDNIRIEIFDLPQLSGQYQIPAGGAIQLPLIGSISLQGKTLEEAAEDIKAAYSRILKRPLITVSLLATRPLNVWIAGEVTRPGSYIIPLTSGAGNNPSVQFPTLVQALERAQGVTQAADIRRIKLRRRLDAEREQVFYFDLQKYLQTGDVTQDITLRDGDSIFVPTSTNVNLADARQLADASFANPTEQPRSVVVLGEVNRPGSYVVIGGETTNSVRTLGLPTVTRAIQLAGGIKSTADIRRIQIRRQTKTGAEQIFNVNLWQLLQAGDIAQDTVVQNGDTIIVPTATELNPTEVAKLSETNFSPATIDVSVIGEVRAPGTVRVPPRTSLNQALLTAGGFTPGRAKTDSVELIRLNLDGTVSRRTVPVDLSQGINETTNPLLRNNDIIVVSRTGITKFSDSLNTALSPANAVVGTILIPTRFLELLRLMGLF